VPLLVLIEAAKAGNGARGGAVCTGLHGTCQQTCRGKLSLATA
jgi:hypothetical protein